MRLVKIGNGKGNDFNFPTVGRSRAMIRGYAHITRHIWGSFVNQLRRLCF
jgi:hypothetical protein